VVWSIFYNGIQLKGSVCICKSILRTTSKYFMKYVISLFQNQKKSTIVYMLSIICFIPFAIIIITYFNSMAFSGVLGWTHQLD